MLPFCQMAFKEAQQNTKFPMNDQPYPLVNHQSKQFGPEVGMDKPASFHSMSGSQALSLMSVPAGFAYF